MKPRFAVRQVETFLCAGGSAWLIAIAHLRPEFWYISLIALIPFLWRVVRLSLIESLLSGIILSVAYSYVTVPISLWAAPGAYIYELVSLTIVFAVYAAAVNRIGRLIGTNAVFMAALWLPLEYLVNHFGGWGSTFTLVETDSSVVLRLGSMFGALTVSFLVVLVNALVLLLLGRAVRALRSETTRSASQSSLFTFPAELIILDRPDYFFPDRRAPPATA